MRDDWDYSLSMSMSWSPKVDTTQQNTIYLKKFTISSESVKHQLRLTSYPPGSPHHTIPPVHLHYKGHSFALPVEDILDAPLISHLSHTTYKAALLPLPCMCSAHSARTWSPIQSNVSLVLPFHNIVGYCRRDLVTWPSLQCRKIELSKPVPFPSIDLTSNSVWSSSGTIIVSCLGPNTDCFRCFVPPSTCAFSNSRISWKSLSRFKDFVLLLCIKCLLFSLIHPRHRFHSHHRNRENKPLAKLTNHTESFSGDFDLKTYRWKQARTWRVQTTERQSEWNSNYHVHHFVLFRDFCTIVDKMSAQVA